MSKLFRKRFLWFFIFFCFITLVTTFVLLDAFVIPHEHQIVSPPVVIEEPIVEEEPKEEEEQKPIITEPIITDNSYLDNDIEITITKYYEYNTNIFVADIKLSSINYLKTALAADKYGKNICQKVSKIARLHNAILAINGDFYGFRNTGYVARNGTLYRGDKRSNKTEDLVIYNDGSFDIIVEGEISAEEVFNRGVLQILSFGPSMVKNGELTIEESTARNLNTINNPRTGIGIIEPLHYVFVTTDGRVNNNKGLSVYQLGVFMQSLGVTTAYNLDGGGSSTMYFNGNLVNIPSDGSYIGERNVSDIVYIGY